jgi:hypothetical protein
MIGRNNPFDLRFVASIRWVGQTGQTRGFCDFATLNDGARAGCIDLKNAWLIHGLNTVATIIPHYAPPTENDTEAYIVDVCKDMGIARDYPLRLDEQWPLLALSAAVWHHEQGQRALAAPLYYGVAAALA